MSITHNIAIRVTRGGVAVVDTTFDKSDAGEQGWDFPQAATLTDQAINLGNITRTKIRSIVIVFDKDTTLKTNSTSSPTETYAFKANVAMVWTNDMPEPCPFSADLTEIYLTTGAAATACKLFFLLSN